MIVAEREVFMTSFTTHDLRPWSMISTNDSWYIRQKLPPPCQRKEIFYSGRLIMDLDDSMTLWCARLKDHLPMADCLRKMRSPAFLAAVYLVLVTVFKATLTSSHTSSDNLEQASTNDLCH